MIKRLIWQMLAGTMGGYTRGFILNKLSDIPDKPYDTNQLAEALNIDYQTTSHHLDVLAKNGLILKTHGKIYFLSKDLQENLKDFNQIWEKIERNIKRDNQSEYGFRTKNFRGT